MHSIDYENAVILAKLDVRHTREQFVIRLVGTGAALVVAVLFAITEWPYASMACVAIAAIEGWGAFRAWQRWRCTKKDIADLRAQKKVRERAEWIALCERMARENQGDRFTPTGAIAESPKDAA